MNLNNDFLERNEYIAGSLVMLIILLTMLLPAIVGWFFSCDNKWNIIITGSTVGSVILVVLLSEGIDKRRFFLSNILTALNLAFAMGATISLPIVLLYTKEYTNAIIVLAFWVQTLLVAVLECLVFKRKNK